MIILIELFHTFRIYELTQSNYVYLKYICLSLLTDNLTKRKFPSFALSSYCSD